MTTTNKTDNLITYQAAIRSLARKHKTTFSEAGEAFSPILVRVQCNIVTMESFDAAMAMKEE